MPHSLTRSFAHGPSPLRRGPLVAVLAYDGVNAFELGLAVEVFGLTDVTDDWYRVVVCSERPGKPFVANNGIKIVAGVGLNALTRANLIIIPGYIDTRARPSLFLLNAIRRAYRRGARIASICAGVFILAEAGLLNDRRATVHWAQAEELINRYPDIRVDPDVLYVDEGNIMSSAGRAAGLDLCLHIVRNDYGAEIANLVAQRLVVPPHREGGQAQFIPRPVHQAEDNSLTSVIAWAQSNPDQGLTIAQLASRAGMSRRTFIRRFEEATGLSPGEWVVQTRLLRARENARSNARLGRRGRNSDRLWFGRRAQTPFSQAARNQPGTLSCSFSDVSWITVRRRPTVSAGVGLANRCFHQCRPAHQGQSRASYYR